MNAPAPLPRTLLLTLLLAAGPLRAQDAPTTGAETVTLTFGWPAGLSARVERESARTTFAEDGPVQVTVRMAHRMDVEQDPRGRLVTYTDFQVDPIEGIAPGEQALVQRLTASLPGYVVSEDGELVGVTGLEELRAGMRTWLDSLIQAETSSLEEAAQAARFLMPITDQALSEEALLASVSQEWTMLVDAWTGREMELGRTEVIDTEEALPIPGAPVVPYRYELSAIARVPCRDGDEDAGCVQLSLVSFPDPETLSEALGSFVTEMAEQMGTAPGQMRYEEVDARAEITLVAEPATLIPHALTVTERSRITVVVDGETQSGGRDETKEVRFRYDGPPG
ncbi:MAG: hypothetical protein P8188_08805 [Gemmatimonadota bacterium]